MSSDRTSEFEQLVVTCYITCYNLKDIRSVPNRKLLCLTLNIMCTQWTQCYNGPFTPSKNGGDVVEVASQTSQLLEWQQGC